MAHSKSRLKPNLYPTASVASDEKANTTIELNSSILLRFSRTEKRACGLTLMDFSVLAQGTRFGVRNFPVSGLGELEPDWQELVLTLITTPPVPQILKVASYMISALDVVPNLSVERPLALEV